MEVLHPAVMDGQTVQSGHQAVAAVVAAAAGNHLAAVVVAGTKPSTGWKG